jgi:FkbM family methyltransferase
MQPSASKTDLKTRIKSALGRMGLFAPAQKIYQRLTPQGRRGRRKLAQLEERMLPHYAEFIHPNDTVYDVGANFGSRVSIFLKLGASRVVAIEPNDEAIKHLRLLFGKDPRVLLIHGGLAETEGTRELYFGEGHALSSMSPEWIKQIKGREKYAQHEWDRKVVVNVTTLDALIGKYGRPSFCKIDVEGFEDSVLRGLHTPIPSLSFEFNAEYLEPAYASITHLEKLGRCEFNVSLGDSMQWRFPQWVSAEEMKKFLSTVVAESNAGDVYARIS